MYSTGIESLCITRKAGYLSFSEKGSLLRISFVDHLSFSLESLMRKWAIQLG